MEQVPERKSESVEREPRVKILLLTSSSYGEHSSNAIPLQVEKDFDIKAAKDEFNGTVDEGKAAMSFGNPMHEDFAKWLIEKGLAKEVDIIPFHEGI